ncbi:hypothetical protein E4T63_12700 [Pseudomonas fluorescens]|uniref:Uncharacterized protein n=1 Tax=Pseudomonas fluorescens TaxID=294 RepID=A0AAP9CIL9_PSEFL|nr:hypothetical protein [Pseudomonas fluorescens]QBX41399.1 hypothetical protein E4T63_12700 [Pseudomonas fluorescens]
MTGDGNLIWIEVLRMTGMGPGYRVWWCCMIENGKHDHFGETLEYISIDLSDKKHKNRVIDFFETRDPLSQEFTCDIQAKWSTGKFHPTLTMSKQDVLGLADLFGEWAARIREGEAD